MDKRKSKMKIFHRRRLVETFYARINEERDRPGRCAGRLAPHFRANVCSARRQTLRSRGTSSSSIIPSAPLDNDVKHSVARLERIGDCSLETGLPGQAPSN